MYICRDCAGDRIRKKIINIITIKRGMRTLRLRMIFLDDPKNIHFRFSLKSV